jgi:hypothetical protein
MNEGQFCPRCVNSTFLDFAVAANDRFDGPHRSILTNWLTAGMGRSVRRRRAPEFDSTIELGLIKGGGFGP